MGSKRKRRKKKTAGRADRDAQRDVAARNERIGVIQVALGVAALLVTLFGVAWVHAGELDAIVVARTDVTQSDTHYRARFEIYNKSYSPVMPFSVVLDCTAAVVASIDPHRFANIRIAPETTVTITSILPLLPERPLRAELTAKHQFVTSRISGEAAIASAARKIPVLPSGDYVRLRDSIYRRVAIEFGTAAVCIVGFLLTATLWIRR